METKFGIEQSRFLIDRFDHYNDTINNKGAFYLSINTFILGGLCLGYNSYSAAIKASGVLYPWIILGGCILLLFCLASTLTTILAISPYLKDNHINDDKPSLIYFGGISRHTCNTFVDKFCRQGENAVLEDSARQAHSLAIGLANKFRWLTWANRFLLGEYIFLTILIFIIFIIS